MKNSNLEDYPSFSRQDWAGLEIGWKVRVFYLNGHNFLAAVDAKTYDSSVVWIRRLGTGSRHMIDYREGVRIQAAGQQQPMHHFEAKEERGRWSWGTEQLRPG